MPNCRMARSDRSVADSREGIEEWRHSREALRSAFVIGNAMKASIFLMMIRVHGGRKFPSASRAFVLAMNHFAHGFSVETGLQFSQNVFFRGRSSS
jgi:hypothetical protein